MSEHIKLEGRDFLVKSDSGYFRYGLPCARPLYLLDVALIRENHISLII
jgi:hypothetical protein